MQSEQLNEKTVGFRGSVTRRLGSCADCASEHATLAGQQNKNHPLWLKRGSDGSDVIFATEKQRNIIKTRTNLN